MATDLSQLEGNGVGISGSTSPHAPENDAELLDAGEGEGMELQDDVRHDEGMSMESLSDAHGEAEHTLDEREMRRHFMDVESSFIPDAVAASLQEHPRGADDTYLELGQPGHGLTSSHIFTQRPGKHLENVLRSWSGAQSGTLNTWDGEGNTSQSVDTEFSSPAQAAMQRGHRRNISSSSASRIAALRSKLFSPNAGMHSQASPPHTPGRYSYAVEPSPEKSSSSPRPQDIHLPGSVRASPRAGNRASPRPSLSARRRISQRSTISNHTMDSDPGAVDDLLETDARGNVLRRLPSFNSLLSFGDKEGELASRGVSGTSVMAGMRRLAAEESDDDERPETPRAPQIFQQVPTDTIITRHVQSIQVPETIARDFRARNRSLSPFKQRPNSSGTVATNTQKRRTLTLKEQNSKIDRLTKENFDLKLKIHFLDQALQSRSEDGVKDLINQNVQFQTDLANERKESQALRRKIKGLEQRVKNQEEALADARDHKPTGLNDDDDDPTLQAEMHEEILYLRQQLDHSENKVTTLTEEVTTKEFEKRKMAEHMRDMVSAKGRDNSGLRETESMWQDLLQAEQNRREQAEEDLQKLREELAALRIERASPALTRLAKRRSKIDGLIDDGMETGGVGVASAALVEQLRHDNAELRRDLGAQTSMLTSRNRERERLQQEIEDLKLYQRKGDGERSVAGESIFERSISRAHQRAASRASEALTAVNEVERDAWERKEGQLRDQNAELRLKYQELERTHSTHLRYITTLEGDFQEMETGLNQNTEDLRALTVERDELIHALDDKEHEYERLEQEALSEIDKMDKQIALLSNQRDESRTRLHKTQTKLQQTMDGYRGLQNELREITQSVMSLEDEKQLSSKTIQNLEQQMSELEAELQKWEQKCREIDEKNRKLEVTQESLHSEITFLREEQETDKIKIGELEDALNAAQQAIADEQDKMREIEAGIVEERQQRDVLENRSKDEVQKVLDDLNTENSKSKDEVRKLRRNLSAKEVEANTWKQKLEDLESSLRDVLGDFNGSKQSLLAEIEKLQRDVETTASKLDRTKMELADKDRLLRHRDGLLESTSLESRRLSDLLDKERASRKHELEQFERASKGQATHMRTIAQQETRMLELESAYIQDKRKMATLEMQFREQLHDRNNLLLALWNRLSTLCGVDWTKANSLVHGQNPSVDIIARNLPAFSKNLIAAIKTVEGLIGSFKVRIRGIEKDLWKDYQTLEHNLDMRARKMDSLEKAMTEMQKAAAEDATQRPPTSRPGSGKNAEEVARLKSESKLLKAELKIHRQHPSALAQQMLNQQSQNNSEHVRRGSSSGSLNGRSTTSPARQIVNQLLRHHSVSGTPSRSSADQMPGPPAPPQSLVLQGVSSQPNEQRWIHRLREMEKRLKAEREGRLLDRQGARQRLEEGRLENEQLRQMLEHERIRSAETPGSALSSKVESEDNGSSVD